MTVEKPAPPTGNGSRFGLGFSTRLDVFRWASFPRFLTFGFFGMLHLTFATGKFIPPRPSRPCRVPLKKSPALRVVFFAAALPGSPTRKCFASIKGQKRRLAEMDWRTDLFIKN
jgi:hypothetical protein